MEKLRVVTYNIHKCVGIDRRYSPERIVRVLREINADVIALQEVVSHSNLRERDHQAKFIARELEMHFCVGENRMHDGGGYGNATLSRFHISQFRNYDISVTRREPRGCLSAVIDVDGVDEFQFLNLHLGTSFFERRKQIHKLLGSRVLQLPEPRGRRIIAGDFNEWSTGLTTRLLKTHYKSVEAKAHLGTKRTFPGILPVVHLDHIYYDSGFKLIGASVHRGRTALFASDHLPIVADLELG